VQAIAEELDASQQRREMIAPAMLPVISRDADHYDSQIYAVCGGGALLPSGGFDCCERRWEIARSVRDDLADMRTPGGLSAVFSGFDQFISSKPGVQGIAQFELRVCACEMMVSNLGVLPFEANFGDLRLEALWGPSVFVGNRGGANDRSRDGAWRNSSAS
jgi:hypothetical protein